MNTITVNVKNCARCGKDHERIEFRELIRPITDDAGNSYLTHWAPCPANEQPILMYVINDDMENIKIVNE